MSSSLFRDLVLLDGAAMTTTLAAGTSRCEGLGAGGGDLLVRVSGADSDQDQSVNGPWTSMITVRRRIQPDHTITAPEPRFRSFRRRSHGCGR